MLLFIYCAIRKKIKTAFCVAVHNLSLGMGRVSNLFQSTPFVLTPAGLTTLDRASFDRRTTKIDTERSLHHVLVNIGLSIHKAAAKEAAE